MVALLATGLSSYGLSCGMRGVFGKDIVQCLDGGIHMRLFQDERRKEAQHCVAGAINKDVALEHLGDGELGQVGRIELRGNHQATATNFDDCTVSFRERAELDRKSTRLNSSHLGI